MRVVVTGSSGFIGRRLVARLASDGHETIALRRVYASPGHDTAPESLATTVFYKDVSDATMAAALAGTTFDAVVNLAAYGVNPGARDSAEMQTVNVDLPASLVRLAHERSAVVVAAGSSAEYLPPVEGSKLTELAPFDPTRIYAASKAAGGLLAMATASQLSVPLRYLRLFNVYGPGEAPHRLLPSLVSARQIVDRVALSDGHQVRDFLHLDDAVDAILAALTRLASGSSGGVAALNVCTGHGSSVREFASVTAEALGVPVDRLGFGDIPRRPDDAPWIVGDPTRIAADLGWSAGYALGPGIRAAVAEITRGGSMKTPTGFNER